MRTTPLTPANATQAPLPHVLWTEGEALPRCPVCQAQLGTVALDSFRVVDDVLRLKCHNRSCNAILLHICAGCAWCSEAYRERERASATQDDPHGDAWLIELQAAARVVDGPLTREAAEAYCQLIIAEERGAGRPLSRSVAWLHHVAFNRMARARGAEGFERMSHADWDCLDDAVIRVHTAAIAEEERAGRPTVRRTIRSSVSA
jgi:hypothetical protein